MELTYSLSVSSEFSRLMLIKSLITTVPSKNRIFINYFQLEKFSSTFSTKYLKREKKKNCFTPHLGISFCSLIT